ncbi:MAG: nuclease-related domain-containing protein [Verrucomicrobia bacterium]|nr:nuclease-related domain-containing protein [Verrucomicrobiota bacterium]
MTDPNVLFTTLVKPALPIFLLVGGLYGVRFVYRRFKSSFKGSLGETLVTQGTFRLLDAALYRGLSDLYVPRPDGDGLTQVDHVVVSPFGIFVIETKNYTGWIYGAEHQAKWTQTFGSGGKFFFQNPIWQNKLHVRALAQFLKLPESKFRSVIFFMGGSAFKTELPEYVIDTSLTGYITGIEDVLLQPEEVAAANAALDALVARTDKRVAKRELLAGIKRRVGK